jgi:hypothetical protein
MRLWQMSGGITRGAGGLHRRKPLRVLAREFFDGIIDVARCMARIRRHVLEAHGKRPVVARILPSARGFPWGPVPDSQSH